MDVDLLDLYGRASEWSVGKVRGATTSLNTRTGCDGWDVRTLRTTCSTRSSTSWDPPGETMHHRRHRYPRTS